MFNHSTRRAWVLAKANLRSVGNASFATEAYSSPSTSSKPPQVERAIRIKSQRQRQVSRRDDSPSDLPRYGRQDRVHREGNASLPPNRLLSEDRDHANLSHRVSHSGQDERPGFSLKERKKYNRNLRRVRNTRQKRFNVSHQLFAIIAEVRDKKITAAEGFVECETMMDSLSNSERREPRLYTAMVRIALIAGKAKKAVNIMTSMKKNGVAPSPHLFRAFFEGMTHQDDAFKKTAGIAKIVDKVFENMEEAWRAAVTTRRTQELYRFGTEDSQSSTAHSFAATLKEAEESFRQDPVPFIVSCEHYLNFLLACEKFDEAAAFLKRARELGAPRESQGQGRQLPFVLASRYLSKILVLEAKDDTHLKEGMIVAWIAIVRAIGSGASAEIISEKVHYTEPSDVRQDRHRMEADRALGNGLAVFEKYSLPERTKLVTTALQRLYGQDNVASLPPIIMEQTLRMALVNCTDEPELALRIFEEALNYHERQTIKTDRFAAPIAETNTLDVFECWTLAVKSALIGTNGLKAGLELVERAKANRTSSSRLRPRHLRLHIFALMMRKATDEMDWRTTLRVWDLFVDSWRESDKRYINIRFFTSFLLSSLRLERRGDWAERADNSIGSEQPEDRLQMRPTRKALQLLDETIGIEGDALWESAEATANLVSKAREEDGETPDERACREYLRVVAQVCKQALDSGDKGKDMAAKEDVDRWKAMMWKANGLLARLKGKADFDGNEAEWLRSGVKSKRPLALTGEDVRELLGNDGH